MRLLTLDVESFYSSEFSLRKMTVPEYILSPFWETICLGAKFDDEPVQMIDGPDVQAFFYSIDPKDTMTISHNALFDACVFAWRYKFVPVRLIDTLGMARCLLGHKLKSLSLDAVAEHFHLPGKTHALGAVKGMHRAQIMGQPALWQAFKQYCAHDVDLTYQIFNKLAPEFPRSEFRVMDLVLRAAICPQFHVDVPLLEQHLADVIAEKERLLLECGADKGDLMSTEKFKQLLLDRGVEIGYKKSPSNPEIEIPAFSKTDTFMSDLLESEDTQVQALASARLGMRSTLGETRGQRLLAIARMQWPT